jgi:hypothetical protein
MIMYSTSIVENAMVDYFLHFHELTPMPTKDTYPVEDR